MCFDVENECIRKKNQECHMKDFFIKNTKGIQRGESLCFEARDIYSYMCCFEHKIMQESASKGINYHPFKATRIMTPQFKCISTYFVLQVSTCKYVRKLYCILKNVAPITKIRWNHKIKYSIKFIHIQQAFISSGLSCSIKF